MAWYTVENVAEIPSPALLVYPARAEQNIRQAVAIRATRGGSGRT